MALFLTNQSHMQVSSSLPALSKFQWLFCVVLLIFFTFCWIIIACVVMLFFASKFLGSLRHNPHHLTSSFIDPEARDCFYFRRSRNFAKYFPMGLRIFIKFFFHIFINSQNSLSVFCTKARFFGTSEKINRTFFPHGFRIFLAKFPSKLL